MKKKIKICVMAVCLILMTAGMFLYRPIQAGAASGTLNLEQIEKKFAQAVKNGDRTVTFTAPMNYTSSQIQNALENAAKSQNRLLSGSVQYTRQTSSSGSGVKYTIQLSDDAFMKITRLKSESAAAKAAVRALKDSKYATNFYSDTSYYEVFRRILAQHPEYSYGTSVWRSTNGAYGYRRNSALTKKQQNAKVKAADAAAAKAVKKCVKSSMSSTQKAKEIHNYLLKNCSYNQRVTLSGNQYHDAFTAYGALVSGSAVCQGYAAAFNLMAQKCGLQSMAVCGTAGGGPHAWTCVKLGSKYRYIDCTWDDTITGETKIVYTYFNLTKEKMSRDHFWNAADYPTSYVKYSKQLM